MTLYESDRRGREIVGRKRDKQIERLENRFKIESAFLVFILNGFILLVFLCKTIFNIKIIHYSYKKN